MSVILRENVLPSGHSTFHGFIIAFSPLFCQGKNAEKKKKKKILHKKGERLK